MIQKWLKKLLFRKKHEVMRLQWEKAQLEHKISKAKKEGLKSSAI